MADKVTFNIFNVHYAALLSNGAYGTVRELPGAVKIDLGPMGALGTTMFNGDIFFAENVKQGYRGTLELAEAPNIFRQEVLGETQDANGAMIEKSSDKTSFFALGFQIDGDVSGALVWFYRCVCEEIPLETETNTEEKNINTTTLSLICAPDDAGRIRAKASPDDVDPTAWFSAVYMPQEV